MREAVAGLLGLSILLGCEPVYLIEPTLDETSTVHEGTITSDETWRAGDNPHKVIGKLVVAGPEAPTLTLEAGVRVLFESGAELHVGTDTEPGALMAVGRGGDPIELRSQREYTSRGYWGTVHFAPLAGESRLEHVTIQDCGGTEDWPQACVRVFGSNAGRPRPVMRDVTIAFSEGYGVVPLAGTAFGEGSRNLRFISMGDFPIRIDAESVVTLPPGLDVEDAGGSPGIKVASGTIETSQTWPDPGIPYVVTGSVRVGGADRPVLTIPAGLELRFGRDGEMLIGVSGPGALVAEGTASAPVLFTTPALEPSGWRGLVFGPDALPSSSITETVIEYGGYPSGYGSSANVTFMRDIGPVIRQSVLRHSGGCGITRRTTAGAWTTDFTDPAHGNRFAGNDLGPQCTTS